MTNIWIDCIFRYQYFLFSLDFAKNSVLSWLFLLFLIIDYYLIPAAIAPIFNSIAEFVIPIGISSKEAKAEYEIHPVIVKARVRKCSI